MIPTKLRSEMYMLEGVNYLQSIDFKTGQHTKTCPHQNIKQSKSEDFSFFP